MRFAFVLGLFGIISTVVALPAEQILLKRAGCGSCAASLGPTAVTCIGAATVRFTNGVNDASCIANILDKAVYHLHPDCQKCIQALGLGGKLGKVTAPVKNAAKTAATGAKKAVGPLTNAAKTAASMVKNAGKPIHAAAQTWFKGAQRVGQAVKNKMPGGK